jgi:hypothetical protein
MGTNSNQKSEHEINLHFNSGLLWIAPIFFHNELNNCMILTTSSATKDYKTRFSAYQSGICTSDT